MSNENIIIRKYRHDDRSAVRQICYETAFLGEPGSVYFESEEILNDVITRYFTDYEPESCFVAEKDNEVIGYIIGACDATVIRKTFLEKILISFIWKVFSRNVLVNRKNARFITELILSAFKREFSFPDVSGDYPATFHTNIKSGCRGLGVGSRLLCRFEDYLHEKNVAGVHCGTISEKACSYYMKHGFKLLFSRRQSYLKFCTGEICTYYLLGKKYQNYQTKSCEKTTNLE